LTSSNDIHRFHDGWRVAAASIVLIYHASSLSLIGSDNALFSRIAHLAVIVFFVISGHAVASSLYRHNDVTKFLSARFSRVYSIAIPALFLTLALDLAVGVNNTGYPEWQYDQWAKFIALSLAFLGESWHMAHRPFSIIPYWSLAYEFWYYLLVAAFSLKNVKLKLALSMLALMFAGPKLILLLPCWLLGVWLYRYRNANFHTRLNLNHQAAIGIFVVLVCVYFVSGTDLALQSLSQKLCNQSIIGNVSKKCGYSQWFIADYPVAILFAAISAHVMFKNAYRKSWVSKLAPHTFGVYLLHYPMLMAVSTIYKPPYSIVLSIAIIVSIFAATVALSILFDKTRPFLAQAFQKVLSKRPLPTLFTK
jgi:peptidoglycan/LPS O-acetylase OafA/YrhL